MKTTLEVRKIKAYGFHGCIDEERLSGGQFEVDVLVHGDFTKASESDKLEDAADYVTISKIVQEQVAIPSDLIETVAYRILKKLKERITQADSFEVRIVKQRAPIEQDVAEVVFTIAG